MKKCTRVARPFHVWDYWLKVISAQRHEIQSGSMRLVQNILFDSKPIYLIEVSNKHSFTCVFRKLSWSTKLYTDVILWIHSTYISMVSHYLNHGLGIPIPISLNVELQQNIWPLLLGTSLPFYTKYIGCVWLLVILILKWQNKASWKSEHVPKHYDKSLSFSIEFNLLMSLHK